MARIANTATTSPALLAAQSYGPGRPMLETSANQINAYPLYQYTACCQTESTTNRKNNTLSIGFQATPGTSPQFMTNFTRAAAFYWQKRNAP